MKDGRTYNPTYQLLSMESGMPEVEQVKFVLRLPPGLHKKIKRRAKSNNTSMNNEITNILNDSFSSSTTDKKLTDLIKRLEKKRVI